MQETHTNRLIDATSPYLQQHAHNPVDWWPWCEEALELARQQNRPILLSIGYSACHWCHVMAHESFENDETAELMNKLFVNIKVDREERPDLDKIYQNAHQLLSQRAGGWPLTVFLTPDDHMPFFAGTYFPLEPRYSMPSFKDLMQRIHQAWLDQQDAVRQQNESLGEALSRLAPQGDMATKLDDNPLQLGVDQLASMFDKQHGGFGKAPKFPHPTNIEQLFRFSSQHPEHAEARSMALFTLKKMALGGVYDQLGGGFCRYSVDDFWMIPHFEKMLYDNGPLLSLCTDAWLMTQDSLFASVCEQSAAWVMREMQSQEGGYFSTLDADSEGEEGKFYAWTPAEVAELLTDQEFDLFAPLYGLDREANFEGKWHLHRYTELHALSAEKGIDIGVAQQLLESASHKLFEARSHRIHPGRDEKILTSWNALMIKGMLRAGRHFNQPAWIESAEKALAFIQSTIWHEGRLFATYKDGRAHLNAYLDDYAYLIDAILEMLQVRWNNNDLEFAVQLADVLLEHFEDETNGGFFFTADDHEQLIQRPKSMADDSMPSGNGVAAYVLQRLGFLLANLNFLDAAERTLQCAWPNLSQAPQAHGALVTALQEHLSPPDIVIARGTQEQLENWYANIENTYQPSALVFAIPSEIELTDALKDKSPRAEGVLYQCSGLKCQQVVTF